MRWVCASRLRLEPMREGRGGAQGKGERGRGEGGKAGMYLVIIPFSARGAAGGSSGAGVSDGAVPCWKSLESTIQMAAEQRGPMQRAAVLEDILRTLPPEVSGQVETISKESPTTVTGPRPGLRRSRTHAQFQALDADRVGESPSVATGTPSDISLQRRCAQLEMQLDKWVGIAQLLASELSYREKRLWDWQMDNTNTRVIMQKFKDRLRRGNSGRSGDGRVGSSSSGGWSGIRANSALARSSSAAGATGSLKSATTSVEPGTPRQIPTSAVGISLLVVEATESDADALKQSCTAIGYRVTVASSGEEAIDILAQSQKAPGFAGRGGASSSSVFELVLCDVELPGIPGVEVSFVSHPPLPLSPLP